MNSLVIGRIPLTATIFTDRPTHIYPNTLHFISEVSHRDFDLLVGRDFLKALKMH